MLRAAFFPVLIENAGKLYYNKCLRKGANAQKAETGVNAMADNKKMVEAITSMEEDFAKWYTDVVKRPN